VLKYSQLNNLPNIKISFAEKTNLDHSLLKLIISVLIREIE
jgi:hypothetical protein